MWMGFSLYEQLTDFFSFFFFLKVSRAKSPKSEYVCSLCHSLNDKSSLYFVSYLWQKVFSLCINVAEMFLDVSFYHTDSSQSSSYHYEIIIMDVR